MYSTLFALSKRRQRQEEATMALPGSVSNLRSTVTHELYSFTHEDILTSIPSGSVSVAKVNYPIDSFIEAFDAFDVSIEIRERLTPTEIIVFEPTLFSKLKGLKTMSVEGPHYLQLKALKRFTKAREHLNKKIPRMAEDLNKIVWNLLVALAGHTPVSLPLPLHGALARNGNIDADRHQRTVVSHPVAHPLSHVASTVDVDPFSDVASNVDLIQFIDKLPLSSIRVGQLIVDRSSGYDVYLQFIDDEAAFKVKGVTAKDDPQFSNMMIKFMEVKCVGELSNTEVSVGMKDGRDILLDLRDEKDAVALVKKITEVADIIAYDARY